MIDNTKKKLQKALELKKDGKRCASYETVVASVMNSYLTPSVEPPISHNNSGWHIQ